MIVSDIPPRRGGWTARKRRPGGDKWKLPGIDPTRLRGKGRSATLPFGEGCKAMSTTRANRVDIVWNTLDFGCCRVRANEWGGDDGRRGTAKRFFPSHRFPAARSKQAAGRDQRPAAAAGVLPKIPAGGDRDRIVVRDDGHRPGGHATRAGRAPAGGEPRARAERLGSIPHRVLSDLRLQADRRAAAQDDHLRPAPCLDRARRSVTRAT